MDHSDIKELAALMKEMGLTSLAYRNGSESLRMRRPAENAPVKEPAQKASQAEAKGEESASSTAYAVKSPMVGVFYSAPGVDEEPFVELGDFVHTGDVLCVIEAMKIMNEITAERDGTITEICTENKEVVEYGQVLFRIVP